MPSQHSKYDQQVNFWCPVILYARFKKRAKELDMTVEEILTAFMLKTAKNTELTEEEYAKCLKRINGRSNPERQG